MTDVRIGIDIGGTFTDIVAEAGDALHSAKVLSTGADPTLAVREGLREVLGRVGATPDAVALIRHGTTVATNAMLEGTYARVGLLTTKGFRDLLEIGRQRRPELYNLFFEKPAPLVPRDLRREVTERLSADGTVVTPLDEAEVAEEAAGLVALGVAGIAICFLHSYLNPMHEARAGEVIRHAYPDLAVVISSDVHPEYREYERLSTTVTNAALSPVMLGYLERFSAACREVGVMVAPEIMQSNGGVASFDDVGRRPVRTLLSGPAAGVIGALESGRSAEYDDLITLDMGGTSTDISLLRGGAPSYARVRDVAGFPVQGASIDVTTIGAGGGSIAWVDSGGRLRVGPRSAGAHPGPAAYGAGGTDPTVTDANVVTGRLPADVALGGGRVLLDSDAAAAAIDTRVGRPLGLSVEEAARAILRVVNTNMALAVRAVSVARGHDPRDYVLLAYGGAGPLHAPDVARELGIPMVVVPPCPGTLCALGLLVSDVRTEFSQTRVMRLAEPRLAEAQVVWSHLAERARDWISRHGDGKALLQHEVDLRYRGQHYELRIFAPRAPWSARDVPVILERFYETHESMYGYSVAGEPVEIVNFRIVVTVPNSARPRPGAVRVTQFEHDVRHVTRPVAWDDGDERRETAILDRAGLLPGMSLAGPAIVLQPDSTVALPPGANAVVDAAGNITISQ